MIFSTKFLSLFFFYLFSTFLSTIDSNTKRRNNQLLLGVTQTSSIFKHKPWEDLVLVVVSFYFI